MRKLHLLALGTLLLAAPLSAQNWDTEFGIQGGFTRIKFTGQPFGSARFDSYSIPSTNVLGAEPGPAAAFAIFPIAPKMALEPGFTFIQQEERGITVGGSFPTIAAASLRLDYALTSSIYGAIGAYTRYAGGSPGGSIGHYAHFQFGLEAAAGYRIHLNPQLNGRIEVQAVTVAKASQNLPFNVYSVLFGVSAPLSEARPATGARRGMPRAENAGGWLPELGVSAGYSSIHISQGPDLTVLSFPGAGSGSVSGLIAVPGAPSLFGIFPLTDKLALETGFDWANLDVSGTHLTSFQLAPRADLAFGKRWYGALGPNVHFVRVSGSKTEGVAGLTAAWGIRFHLSGALRGRVELSYGVNAKRRTTFGLGGIPSSVLGLNFGMMMPLK
ncbi:MAG TPA: hypothetical protein VJN62_08445 [Gemmatimonadales bacterium]|nr:hypothetical protein [Gemmatimonadales bacterium]